MRDANYLVRIAWIIQQVEGPVQYRFPAWAYHYIQVGSTCTSFFASLSYLNPFCRFYFILNTSCLVDL